MNESQKINLVGEGRTSATDDGWRPARRRGDSLALDTDNDTLTLGSGSDIMSLGNGGDAMTLSSNGDTLSIAVTH